MSELTYMRMSKTTCIWIAILALGCNVTADRKDCIMGNLPLTRTVTVDDSDPVPSGLLGELQDEIISGAFGQSIVNMDGGAFTLQSGTGTCADGRWSFSAVPAVLVLHPRLFSGTLIDELDFWGNTGGAGTLTYKIRTRQMLTGAAAVDIATQTKTGAAGRGASLMVGLVGGGAVVAAPYLVPGSLPGAGVVSLPSLWFEIQVNNVANTFDGITLMVHRP